MATQKKLLLYELNEAETEVKNTQNCVMLKSIGIKTPRSARNDLRFLPEQPEQQPEQNSNNSAENG